VCFQTKACGKEIEGGDIGAFYRGKLMWRSGRLAAIPGEEKHDGVTVPTHS